MTAGLAGAIFKRDRTIVIAGLAGVIALSWAYMVHTAWDMMSSMDMNASMEMGMQMALPDLHPWGMVDFAFVFLMWTVMQIAMMTPSAAPMVLTYARFGRQNQQEQAPFLITAIFFLGYILVWAASSAGATIAQWGLHTAALLSPMMVSTSPLVGGIILVSAGIFQFTSLKHACLHHCRTPMGFMMTEWREGKRGALVMGLRHGGFCVVCCWLLMALLFVAGVMNLLWIAAIAAYVLIEKVVPYGHWVSRTIGLFIILLGMGMILGISSL